VVAGIARECLPCLGTNRPGTTDSGHNHKIAENWLAKVPAPDRPGQLWQSDITYIETQEGWLMALSGLYPRWLFAPLHRSRAE
jgi:hypothetical protein